MARLGGFRSFGKMRSDDEVSADSGRSRDEDRSAQVDPKAAVNPVAKSVFWRAECTNRIWLGREYHDRSRDRLKSISSPGEMLATFPSLIAPVSRQSAGRSRSV